MLLANEGRQDLHALLKVNMFSSNLQQLEQLAAISRNQQELAGTSRN
jgi:hypothetical protein